MAMQELEQSVCQRYGWSAQFFVVATTSSSAVAPECWAVRVHRGLLDQPNTFSTDICDMKLGKAAAAKLALDGLRADIQREQAKPTVISLQDAVGHLFHARIVTSSDVVWTEFWKNPPTVVGIDTEGNSCIPPLLLQIATEDLVILETPISGLSENVQRLLSDDTIVKVFCENGAHRDKRSLGLCVPDDMVTGPVVDLEYLAAECMGHVKVPRGIGKLVALTMPEVRVRIDKKAKRLGAIGTFTAIEQGFRKPLRGVHDLSLIEQRYAALDAWCTLQIWIRLKGSEGGAENPIVS
jgi:hypothetical protein